MVEEVQIVPQDNDANDALDTSVIFDDDPRSKLMQTLLDDTTAGMMQYEGLDLTWEEKLNQVPLLENPEINKIREA